MQRVVEPPHERRHGVRRIEALVRIGLPGEVRVAGHLPAAQVDRLEARLDHLHRLVRRSSRRARARSRRRATSCHSRSAPRRASVCSTRTEPRSLTTSSAEYGRSMPAQLLALPLALELRRFVRDGARSLLISPPGSRTRAASGTRRSAPTSATRSNSSAARGSRSSPDSSAAIARTSSARDRARRRRARRRGAPTARAARARSPRSPTSSIRLWIAAAPTPPSHASR